jgi:hypothetical protein
LIQLYSHGIVSIQGARNADEHLSKVGIDSPVSSFVGVRQCGAGYLTAESHVIELALHGTQTSLDVTQAFSVSQLSESHGEKLIPTGEAL